MKDFKELYQTADWKQEKHVPVIEAASKVKKGEFFNITVTVGKEIAHPNKTEHHIRWISLFYIAEGDKFPFQICKSEFTSHGESALGPDTSNVYTKPEITASFKIDKPGTIYATSYCNIHGLWSNAVEIKVG